MQQKVTSAYYNVNSNDKTLTTIYKQLADSLPTILASYMEWCALFKICCFINVGSIFNKHFYGLLRTSMDS